MARTLHAAWLAREADALRFLEGDCRDPAARAAAVERAAARTIPPALAAELGAQQHALVPSTSRAANVELLSRPGTVVVVTGQQVGLFLGPLYTFYKAASAIVAARALSAETGRPCVPVFWLQTEDHDFAEIDHCEVPPREAGAPVRISLQGGDDRRSVQTRRLDASIEDCLAAIAAEVSGSLRGAEVLDTLRRHYVPGRRLHEAFAGLLGELFAEEGLLLFDPRREAVARLWAPQLRRAVEEAGPISRALLERCEALRSCGFEPQVHVRPGSPLVFFHPDGPDGPRFRLEPAGGEGFALVGDERRVSRAELLRRIDEEPLAFSSSALLRPLLQDALFPTAAYVGGPGELAYVAQLGPLHRHFSLKPSLFVPRASFRLIDPGTRRTLQQLDLEPKDAARAEDELLAALAPPDDGGLPSPSLFEQRLREGTAPAIEQAAMVAAPLSPQLAKAARRTQATVERAILRLSAKYRRDRLERAEVILARIRRLRAALAPEGEPQERRYCWPPYAARFGIPRLTEAVLGAIHPFEPGIRELEP